MKHNHHTTSMARNELTRILITLLALSSFLSADVSATTQSTTTTITETDASPQDDQTDTKILQSSLSHFSDGEEDDIEGEETMAIDFSRFYHSEEDDDDVANVDSNENEHHHGEDEKVRQVTDDDDTVIVGTHVISKRSCYEYATAIDILYTTVEATQLQWIGIFKQDGKISKYDELRLNDLPQFYQNRHERHHHHDQKTSPLQWQWTCAHATKSKANQRRRLVSTTAIRHHQFVRKQGQGHHHRVPDQETEEEGNGFYCNSNGQWNELTFNNQVNLSNYDRQERQNKKDSYGSGVGSNDNQSDGKSSSLDDTTGSDDEHTKAVFFPPRKVLRPGTYIAQSHGVGFFGHTTSAESSTFEILPPGKICKFNEPNQEKAEEDNDEKRSGQGVSAGNGMMSSTTTATAATTKKSSNLRWTQQKTSIDMT